MHIIYQIFELLHERMTWLYVGTAAIAVMFFAAEFIFMIRENRSEDHDVS